MKKVLLISGLLAVGLTLNAQEKRFSLYEEFTGENCPPCAATNPGLEQLMTQGNNPDKVIMIKYQSPIPTAGPIYKQNTIDVNTRLSVYGVHSAPNGRMDGEIQPESDAAGHPGHPAYMSQNYIDQETAKPSSFKIHFSNYEISNGTLNATVDITAVQAVSTKNLVFLSALVEDLSFTKPPGTNGEKEFPNVVREMYPNAIGKTLPNDWTSGQTETVKISGKVPDYVDLNNRHAFVVWLQDMSDKSIKQAAVVDKSVTGINNVVSNSNDLKIYPNPVVNQLSIDLQLEQSSTVDFSIVNLLGQQINTVSKDLAQGQNKITLNTESLAPGVYFLNITTGSGAIQQKFVKQ